MTHLGNVPGLEEVRGLEDLFVGDAVLLGGGQEGLDVLHEKKGRALEQPAGSLYHNEVFPGPKTLIRYAMEPRI